MAQSGHGFGRVTDIAVVGELIHWLRGRLPETTMKDEGHPGQRRLTIQFLRLSDNTTIVGLVGELRGQGAVELREALADELTGSPEQLVINLSNIVEIDVDGVDALHSVAEIAAEWDVEFCLVVTPDGRVRRRLDALKRTEFFEIFPSAIEALRHSR